MAKTGRPSKFSPQIQSHIFFLARRGCTDAQISEVLGVSEVSFNTWKVKHGFLESLNDAKGEADDLVERSLFERALGYDHPDTKVFCMKNGEVVTVPVIKHEPPDVTACIFWLKNRRKLAWRDSKDVEHSGTITIEDLVVGARELVHSRLNGDA